jgi:hypothetical protein
MRVIWKFNKIFLKIIIKNMRIEVGDKMLFSTLIFKELVKIEEFKLINLLENIQEAVKCNIKKLVSSGIL